MSVRVTHNQRWDSEANPICMRKFQGQCLQCNDQGKDPQLGHKPDEKPLIELLWKPGPENKLKNKQDIGGNHEQVCFKCIKSQAF